MKKIVILFLYLVNVLMAHAQNAEGKIAGDWYNEELDKSTINVYKSTDGLWYAKITKSEDPDKVGKMLLSKVKYDATEKVHTGILTPPTNSMEINATITFTKDGKLKLVGKKLVMTKTYYWTKQ